MRGEVKEYPLSSRTRRRVGQTADISLRDEDVRVDGMVKP